MRLELTAVYRKVQDGYVAWIEEYPGALTQTTRSTKRVPIWMTRCA